MPRLRSTCKCYVLQLSFIMMLSHEVSTTRIHCFSPSISKSSGSDLDNGKVRSDIAALSAFQYLPTRLTSPYITVISDYSLERTTINVFVTVTVTHSDLIVARMRSIS